MKFDLEVSSLGGVVRVEIRTVREGDVWAAYLGLVAAQREDVCLLLGYGGVPHRFSGSSEKEAEQTAREFIQRTYHVSRMIWS
jgi:hypothetical protein